MDSEDSIERKNQYKLNLMLGYPRKHIEIYAIDAENYFKPSFLKAINENTKVSFESIMTKPFKGVYTFEMLQPEFCEKLMSEVDSFVKWADDQKIEIMQPPNAMNKHVTVLDDFGLKRMLDRLMQDYICPISKVLFTEFGGSSLDSHHGFVTEYGNNKDVEMGLHVDDAEVTLNVCLGKIFSGGDLFFQGVRCDEHLTSKTQPEENLSFPQVQGKAFLYSGRHRHGAKPTISGSRVNLVLWCRSSSFRKSQKHQTDFFSWCTECRGTKLPPRKRTMREMQSAS